MIVQLFELRLLVHDRSGSSDAVEFGVTLIDLLKPAATRAAATKNNFVIKKNNPSKMWAVIATSQRGYPSGAAV